MDEIKLPCGTPLKKSRACESFFSEGGLFVLHEWKDGACTAKSCIHAGSLRGTGAEAISWLNARVEELVSSLGAVIVPGDARERVAKVLCEKTNGSLAWTTNSLARADAVDKASAVLAALGMVKP